MADGTYLKNVGKVDLSSGTFKVVLCTASYTANLSTDDYLADITAGNRVATQTLTATYADGVFDATDSVFPTVAAGSTVTHGVIYKDTGDEATSPLVWHFDSYTGLPATTSGADINLAWPNDGNKIFKFANS